jgi:TolA-binding protein
MTDDLLRELGKQLPYDRPDAARRDSVRSSLLVEATEQRHPDARRRWLVVGGSFATGALAAAAVAVIVVRNGREPVSGETPAAAQITASSQARLEHHVVPTTTGVDEIVQVHDGTVRLAVDHVRSGDHVRLRTHDAAVEGSGEYEAVVIAETLSAVSVRSGTAQVTVDGQRTVFLASGQTWRSSIITTDLSPASPARVATTTSPSSTATADKPTIVSDKVSADASARIDKPSAVTTMDRIGSGADKTATDKAVRTSDKTSATDKTSVTERTVRTSDKPFATDKTSDRAVRTSDKPFATDKTSGKTVRTSDKTSADTTARTSDTVVSGADKTVIRTDKTASDKTGSDKTSDKVASDKSDKTTTANGSDKSLRTDATSSTAGKARAQSVIERRFQAGWALLRGGKPSEAAAELGAAADAAPDDPLAADARYFQAVALVRAGQRAEAERVLLAFLDHAPRSLRRGRAAVLLGRLIGERGDPASARAWLKSAETDPDPEIAAAARAGLEELAKKP